MCGQFGTSSILIPLMSNPGIGAYGWGLFCSPDSSQGWYSGLCVCAPLVRHLGEELGGGFFSSFPWSYGPSVASGSSELVSQDGWLVSSILFLLSTGQVTTRTCGSSLPVCAVWFNLF
jgi:hypothetical protein